MKRRSPSRRQLLQIGAALGGSLLAGEKRRRLETNPRGSLPIPGRTFESNGLGEARRRQSRVRLERSPQADALQRA